MIKKERKKEKAKAKTLPSQPPPTNIPIYFILPLKLFNSFSLLKDPRKKKNEYLVSPPLPSLTPFFLSSVMIFSLHFDFNFLLIFGFFGVFVCVCVCVYGSSSFMAYFFFLSFFLSFFLLDPPLLSFSLSN